MFNLVGIKKIVNHKKCHYFCSKTLQLMFFKRIRLCKISLTAIALTALLMTGCGNSDSFSITGEIEGLGTRNLRFYYHDGNSVKVGLASALDSKFRFEGHSKHPAIITITTGQRNVLGTVVAGNGDDIMLTLSARDPFKMKADGNRTTKELAEFVTVNSDVLASGDSQKINETVENYVSQFPKRQTSTLLMLTFYDATRDPARADSIIQSIDPKARPNNFVAGYRDQLQRASVTSEPEAIQPVTLYCEKDSLTTIDPKRNRLTLFTFVKGTEALDDSIVERLKTIEKNKDVKIVNVFLDNDTTIWKSNLKTSTPPGLNTWVTGSTSSPRISQFGLRHIPAFAVVDSTSTLLYNGTSLSAAAQLLN